MDSVAQNDLQSLIEAEAKAVRLFQTLEARQLIQSGLTEQELSDTVHELAFELFGIRKYWHKRIVRAGENTLSIYRDNPENRTIEDDDILFLDFGPVFEDWEADYGRTYVLGNDPHKHRLKSDLEAAFQQARAFYFQKDGALSGSEFYQYLYQLAREFGWQYGGPYAGHLVGQFPHETTLGEKTLHYIHPDNHTLMSDPDPFGNPRHWILEIHFIDPERRFGGFVEQLLLP